MASSNPLSVFPGYSSQTFTYKSVDGVDIKLDVLGPDVKAQDPAVVLLHYHGGFLVVGDRYAFLPYWLVNACVTRGWIFVTPDYRLLPESIAHDSVEDATEAFNWVCESLPTILGRQIGTVLLAGSSAGAYLALTTASRLQKQPSALLLIYGFLDVTESRYITKGTNIFGRPPIDSGPALEEFPLVAQGRRQRAVITEYPAPADPATDPRFGLISALHLESRWPDYMTGVDGLGQVIAAQGTSAIPEDHQVLFPLTFASLEKLPTTILLHGENDSAVPASQSKMALKALRAAGVDVHTEFPQDAEHGFDSRLGNIDVEKGGDEGNLALQSLRRAIQILTEIVKLRN